MNALQTGCNIVIHSTETRCTPSKQIRRSGADLFGMWNKTERSAKIEGGMPR